MKLTAKQIHVLQTMRRAQGYWNQGHYKVVHVYGEQDEAFKPGGKLVVAGALRSMKKLGLVNLTQQTQRWYLTDAGNKFLDGLETPQ